MIKYILTSSFCGFVSTLVSIIISLTFIYIDLFYVKFVGGKKQRQRETDNDIER